MTHQDIETASDATPREMYDAPPAVATNGSQRERIWRRLAGVAVVFLAALCVNVAVGIPIIHSEHTISNTDETSYFDYLYKVGQGHYVIGRGEHIAPAVAKVVGCRGIGTVIKPDKPTCKGTTNAWAGMLDTASIDPPTYFVLTSLGARVFMHLGVTHDLLTAGRLVGLVWGALSVTAFFFFARRFGAGSVSAALAALLLVADPLVARQWTYITPHALDVLVGIGVVWAGLHWMRSRRSLWLVGLAGLVPPLCKATDVLAPVAVGLAFVVSAFWPGTSLYRQWRRVLLGIAALIAGLAVGTAITVGMRAHYALISGNEFPQFDVHRFRFEYLTTQVGTFLQSPSGGTYMLLGLAAMYLIVGCVLRFVLAPVDEPSADMRPLAVAVTVGLVFGAWVFVLSNYFLIHQSVLIPTRYGLALLPAVLLLVARAIRARGMQIVFAVLVITWIAITVSTAGP